MGYIHDNLMPREKVLYAARVSRAVFLPSVLMFFIALAAFVYGLSGVVHNNAFVTKNSARTY